jgi:hypothetical protein
MDPIRSSPCACLGSLRRSLPTSCHGTQGDAFAKVSYPNPVVPRLTDQTPSRGYAQGPRPIGNPRCGWSGSAPVLYCLPSSAFRWFDGVGMRELQLSFFRSEDKCRSRDHASVISRDARDDNGHPHNVLGTIFLSSTHCPRNSAARLAEHANQEQPLIHSISVRAYRSLRTSACIMGCTIFRKC